MNKKIMMVATTLMVGGIFSFPASAISEAYRAQLEKSGCTQVSESNGTCDPTLTHKQNQHAQAQNGVKDDSQENRDLARSIDSDIAGKYQGQAVDYMRVTGWKPLNEEQTRWKKSGHTAEFDMNSEGKVMGVVVR